MGTAAGGMLFLTRGHVAWAHRAVVLLAACPYPHAAQGRFPKSSGVGGLEPGIHLLWLVAGAQAKIVNREIHAQRVDHLARIHRVGWVPESFELLKRFH